MKHTMDELHQWQALPLSIKISMTKQRIRDWYNAYDGNVYVSFSGGKDSTVLLDIVRSMYQDVKAVFCDTGLEYPEIRDFVFQHDNVTVLKPKKNLRQVICEYGYPLISKEVSECVQGARKYLTSILQERDALTDRQTDRQTDRPYRYNYERITGTGAYQAHPIRNTSHIPIRDGQIAWNLQTNNPGSNQAGGYDNKWRKLRGIGEYSKQADDRQIRWKQSTISDHVRNAHERQEPSDKGEYPQQRQVDFFTRKVQVYDRCAV